MYGSLSCHTDISLHNNILWFDLGGGGGGGGGGTKSCKYGTVDSQGKDHNFVGTVNSMTDPISGTNV